MIARRPVLFGSLLAASSVGPALAAGEPAWRSPSPAAASPNRYVSAGTPVDVKSFGARGDGHTLDLEPVRRAITASSHVLFPPGDYWLGTLPSPDVLLPLRRRRNVLIEGHGARLVCNTTAPVVPTFFLIESCSHVTIAGLGFADKGADPTRKYRGAVAVRLSADRSPCRVITLANLSGDGLVALVIANATEHRCSNITIRDCSIENAYYGLNFQNNGDLVTADLYSRNVRRAYFPYGVQFHEISLVSSDLANASAHVLVKCYSLPTRYISLRLLAHNVTKAGSLLSIEQQHASDSGVIEFISANISCSGDAKGKIVFRAYDSSGDPLAVTDSAYRFINITAANADCDFETSFDDVTSVYLVCDSIGIPAESRGSPAPPLAKEPKWAGF